MATASSLDEGLLKRIDELQLSEHLFRLKDAMFSTGRKISVDRAKLAMHSWIESDGEDIEVRRAKLFKDILEGVPIAIYDFDMIVGRETEHLVGAPVFVDQTGDVIPGLWEASDTPDNRGLFGALSEEEREVLKECSRFLPGRRRLIASESWALWSAPGFQDITDAKGSDPTPTRTSGITCRHEKILAKGMRGLIEEAEVGIRRFKEMKKSTSTSFIYNGDHGLPGHD